jgi:hypothetical protein
MSSINNDSTPAPDTLTSPTDPFPIGDMDKASDAFTTAPAADTPPDCQLQPTTGPDDSVSQLSVGTDQLHSGNTFGDVAQGVVDGLEAAAEYVRTTDGKQMLDTLQTFIKNNPGVSVTVAAAFGFVVGRSIRCDS